MKKPEVPKERNLVKAALRRVFSRSELRRKAVEKVLVKDYADPQRPRVTKWGRCAECQTMTPLYKMQVDHRDPLIPIGKGLEDLSWDEVVDRLWCPEENLQALCDTCHRAKSSLEAKARKLAKKGSKK